MMHGAYTYCRMMHGAYRVKMCGFYVIEMLLEEFKFLANRK
jgi:hypothetical protein